jgi:hypothetical protein
MRGPAQGFPEKQIRVAEREIIEIPDAAGWPEVLAE